MAVGKSGVLEHKSGNISETRKYRGKVTIIIMKSYMKYTIKTHKIDNKNIDKLEFKKTLKH